MSRSVAVAVASALALTATAAAAPQGIDTRANSMGGAQVSSADYRSAGFANPALLTRADEDDDWGLVLPTVSVFAGDPDQLIDAADEFANEFERLEDLFDMGGMPTQAELDSLALELLDLNGRNLIANVGAGLAFAMPSDTLGFSIIVDSRLSARSFVDVDPNDAAAIAGSLGGGALPELGSTAVVTGGLVTDYGVALAHAFELGSTSLSIGVTPKLQTIETYNYRIDANDFDEGEERDDFTDERFRNDDAGFNIDAGLLFEPTQSTAIGLSVRNLVSRDVTSVTTLGQQFTFQVQPVATLGASADLGPVTVAADYDLTEIEPFDYAPGSQFLGLGAEFGLSWAQLRGGFRTDVKDQVKDTFTAGLGFSPWDVFHLDLGGAFGDDTYGAYLQLGWTF